MRHDNKITLVRSFDKVVFGTARSVTQTSSKSYRIASGEVQIKFKGKWFNVDEINASGTDRVNAMYRNKGINAGVSGSCEISNWGQHS